MENGKENNVGHGLSMNTIYNMDCIEGMKLIPNGSIDAIITDPPYEIGFMGKGWDDTGIANNVDMWKECLRVLKPGGHLLSFAATRTYHRMASAIEDAGFEVRDMIEWVYGSGFPKSLNIGKAVDKKPKADSVKDWKKWLDIQINNSGKSKQQINDECGFTATSYVKTDNKDYWSSNLPKNGKWRIMKKVIGIKTDEYDWVEQDNCGERGYVEPTGGLAGGSGNTVGCFTGKQLSNNAIDDRAKQWEGWGTALKPAHEPICMARKPLSEKTVVENVLKYGTGGINIETSRVTSNSPALQNNQDYENVCNEFSYIQQSFLSSLSDTFFLSHELSQGYLKHIFFVLSPYNNCDTITLHTEVILAHTFDKGLQDALCDYDLKVQNVNEYVQSAIKAPNFQDDYPTLFSFCDALLQKKAIPFKDIVALSNDVQVYISDFISSLENITPSYNNLLNSFFVVFPYIVMLINKSPTLYLFHQQKQENVGRFPANLIHDNSEEVRECFPETKSVVRISEDKDEQQNTWSLGRTGITPRGHNDSGNASRFFKSIIYQAKASKSDRGQDNNHATVKPTALMEYLIKMVTPKGGVVLDPFAGSGTTLVAAKKNGYNYIGFELDEGYREIANKRIEKQKEDKGLFVDYRDFGII